MVLHPEFYKDTSGGVLPEICEPLPGTATTPAHACRSALSLLRCHSCHYGKSVCAGKEYAQADSRYATRDSFVVTMEAVTAFGEGPACFAVVFGILTRRPWRYTLQILVSLGQMYGDVLYFGTTVLEGESSS